MKRIITIILFLLPIIIFAQKRDKGEQFYKQNWNRFVTAYAEYTYRKIGNIINPIVKVKNELPYDITNVYIKGMYLNPKGEVIKVEISAPFSVMEGEQVTINFPSLNRGVKFKAQIVGVDCKKIKLSYLCTECIDPY